MYLFPTKEEMDSLYRQINPTARIMDYLFNPSRLTIRKIKGDMK